MGMTTQEIGLREARAEIGDIANRAYISGEVTYLTRNGRPIAAVAPVTRITGAGAPEVTFAVPTGENAKYGALAVLRLMRQLADGVTGLKVGDIDIDDITGDLSKALRDLFGGGEPSDDVTDAAVAVFRVLDQAINAAR